MMQPFALYREPDDAQMSYYRLDRADKTLAKICDADVTVIKLIGFDAQCVDGSWRSWRPCVWSGGGGADSSLATSLLSEPFKEPDVLP